MFRDFGCRMNIRNICPDDYQQIISILDEWWGGRKMSDMLPKLFFVHFCETSFIAETDQEITGFLIGFLSQTYSDEAYIHFLGVHPKFRKQGIGRLLYEQFFKTVRKFGRIRVRCVTSEINKNSIAYHLRMGFKIESSDCKYNSIYYYQNYDGSGQNRVLFVKQL
ncbi:GNAT family N-acetyltransferase [Moorena sp. SIOASIH]|uniref:GNAT family N-acetyltransferase n=1 Tax=Moorena sp. SIOASIH TaxID=2607817 RepID=UPI0025D1FE34|nr:GNAT family N-acetyltransferase [Moorena sp. SIOASIH]